VLASPELAESSDYALAKDFGVNHATARRERYLLERLGLIPVITVRRGIDGRLRITARKGK
jgi:hypothetical protein